VFYSPIHCFVHIYSPQKKNSLFKILNAVAVLPLIEAEKGGHVNCMYIQKENMSLVIVLQKLSLYQLSSFLCSMPTNQSVYTTRNLTSKELKIQQHSVQGVRLSTLVKTAWREKRDDSNSYWNQEYGYRHLLRQSGVKSEMTRTATGAKNMAIDTR
jgi:hypothetical protein